jgi:4-hydroxy-3-methylbut-2-enyl diphosphate reductase
MAPNTDKPPAGRRHGEGHACPLARQASRGLPAGEGGPAIEVAARSGVCFGVRRALALSAEALAGGRTVYSLGPVIHNPQEMARLQAKGLAVVESLQDARPGGILLVRSHGLAPGPLEEARERGLDVVDATCPLVRRVQTLAMDLAAEAYEVLVAGDAAHPEVRAILGHAPQARVVATPQEARGLGLKGKVALVAQTTFSPEQFRRLARDLAGRDLAELRVLTTICQATVERQRAAADLAGRVDVMFIIGGRNSANTRRLAGRCAGRRAAVRHVETPQEVRPQDVRGRRRVGVAAGASTPPWVIEAVCGRIRELLQAK